MIDGYRDDAVASNRVHLSKVPVAQLSKPREKVTGQNLGLELEGETQLQWVVDPHMVEQESWQGHGGTRRYRRIT